MAYAGDKNDNRRGDLIAYLRSISPKAPPAP
jgi:cytochrome c2